MFAVIYRSYLKPGTETIYREAWQTVADYFIEHCGALGSTLHKTEDNLWVAYSRWPSKVTRDAVWLSDDNDNQALPRNIIESINTIKNCLVLENKLPDIEMEVVEDKMLKSIK